MRNCVLEAFFIYQKLYLDLSFLNKMRPKEQIGTYQEGFVMFVMLSRF